MQQIQEGLDLSKLKKANLRTYENLNSFINTHCKSSCYSFQIKKCTNDVCFYCSVLQPPRLDTEVFNSLQFLPDPMLDATKEHYQSFHNLYGNETSEKDRPSLASDKITSETDAQNKSLLVTQKIRAVITCVLCNKPRCIYANTNLSCGANILVQRVKDEKVYVCGSQLFPTTSKYHTNIVTRCALVCDSNIEINYFGAKLIKLPDICVYCGSSHDLSNDQVMQDLKRMYVRVRPICCHCKHIGKQPLTWGPNNIAKKKKDK